MSISASAMRVAMRQLQEIHLNPIDGVKLCNGDDLSEILAEIDGPEDTPFVGGVFLVALVLTAEFPETAPKGYFRTRIFHPNVSDKGEICVNTLKKDWDPSLGLRHVFTVIRCLLIEPNPESALNEEAGRLLLEEYGEYVKKARMHCLVHAMKESASQDSVGGLQTRNANDSNAVEKKNSEKNVSIAEKKKAALKKL